MSKLVLHCSDKSNHHADQANPHIMPHFSQKLAFAGKPNSGKGSAAKKIALLADPPYTKIFLCHYDLKTSEYDDLDITQKFDADSLPADGNEFLTRGEKNLLIFDEINFTGMSKQVRGKIERYFLYYSSHHDCTMFCINQEFVSIPTTIRRACMIWNIWPSSDVMSQRDISRKTGYDVPALQRKYLKDKWSFLTFDMSGDGYPLRHSFFTPIEE